MRHNIHIHIYFYGFCMRFSTEMDGLAVNSRLANWRSRCEDAKGGICGRDTSTMGIYNVSEHRSMVYGLWHIGILSSFFFFLRLLLSGCGCVFCTPETIAWGRGICMMMASLTWAFTGLRWFNRYCSGRHVLET